MRCRFWLVCLMLLGCCGLAAPLRAQELPKSADPPAAASEPVAPDVQAEALWDGRKIVPFRAIDYPKMVPARDADFLDDDEYVLGVTINGESRAYPTRFAWWHHMINDKVNKRGKEAPEFTIAYCSVCNSGLRYDPFVNGKRLLFDFYGLYNGVVTMFDRETESVWLTIGGRAVKGPMLGARLKIAPLLDTTWGEWKKLHPDTLVMSPDNEFRRAYRPKGMAEPRGYDRFPAPFFQPTMTHSDSRLPPFDKVLGVIWSAAGTDNPSSETVLRRAYPVKTLLEAGGVLNDMLGTAPVAVFLEPQTMAANAFARVLDGKTLTFAQAVVRADGKTLEVYFVDRETGTRWNIEGVGEKGPLARKRLTRLENHLSQWYGWVAYYPQTSIYGRTEPPQPADPKTLTPVQRPTEPKRQSDKN